MERTTKTLSPAGSLVLAAAGSLLLTAAAPAQPAETTTIDEIVMYALDSDTRDLLRYEFLSDSFTIVGNAGLTDAECLGYIPTGPYMGLYTMPRKGGEVGRLVRISLADASTTVYPISTGYKDVTGMLGYEDGPGNWILLAISREDPVALLEIDPSDGSATVRVGLDEEFEGLARDAEGTVFGCTTENVYIIDIDTGAATNMGGTGYDKVEALEFCFGYKSTGVEIPGVDPMWTEFGVLFGFDDDNNALIVIDPATGDAVDYAPCAFSSIDSEGLVFTSRWPYEPDSILYD